MKRSMIISNIGGNESGSSFISMKKHIVRMKTIVAYITLIIILTIGYTSVNAQEKLQFKIGYNPGMPVGSFKDFMGKNSFRGYLGELSYPLNERLKVGLGVSYNDYYEKFPRRLYQSKDGTISAVITNSIQTTPILLKANYDLTSTGLIRPYVGLGAGVNLVGFAQYLGEFGERKTSFKPAVGAEAGINLPFNKETRTSGLNLGAHFNYLPYKYGTLKNLNNWGLHLGVFFPLR